MQKVGEIMNKKLFVKIFLILVAVVSNVMIIKYVDKHKEYNVNLEVNIKSNSTQDIQLYYDNTNEMQWNEANSQIRRYEANQDKEVIFSIPSECRMLRLDFGDKVSDCIISKIRIKYKKSCSDTVINKSVVTQSQGIDKIKDEKKGLYVKTTSDDPYIVFDLTSVDFTHINQNHNKTMLRKNIMLCVCIDFIIFTILMRFDIIIDTLYMILVNYKLIFSLAKNDFKTKYAGSYFGIIWSFIQPIVTVLVYWFVFQVAFQGQPIDGCPYVLWLISGLVPWFFFQEALQSGTNSLIEYSYLVKKVVFNISVIPIVKIVSALFVHLFFVLVVLAIYLLSGFGVSVYAVQIIYYSFCMVVLATALAYITSSLVIFFRDLGQIIGIILQIGIWITPIMWDYKSVASPGLAIILKINPMFYIVDGYRDSLVTHQWLWNNPNMTVYFWTLTLLLLGFGGILFKKLKIHFADVL